MGRRDEPRQGPGRTGLGQKERLSAAGIEPVNQAIALILLGFVIPSRPTLCPRVPSLSPLAGHTGGTCAPAPLPGEVKKLRAGLCVWGYQDVRHSRAAAACQPYTPARIRLPSISEVQTIIVRYRP